MKTQLRFFASDRIPHLVKSKSFARQNARNCFLSSVIACLLVTALPLVVLAGDSCGSGTGAAKDVAAANSGQPTLQELATEGGHTKIAELNSRPCLE